MNRRSKFRVYLAGKPECGTHVDVVADAQARTDELEQLALLTLRAMAKPDVVDDTLRFDRAELIA